MSTKCYQCTGAPEYKCAPNYFDSKEHPTCMDVSQTPYTRWEKFSECQRYCNPGPPKPGFRAACWKREDGECVRVVPENPYGGYYSECPLRPGLFPTREDCKTGFQPLIPAKKRQDWIYWVVGIVALVLIILLVILVVWLARR